MKQINIAKVNKAISQSTFTELYQLHLEMKEIQRMSKHAMNEIEHALATMHFAETVNDMRQDFSCKSCTVSHQNIKVNISTNRKTEWNKEKLLALIKKYDLPKEAVQFTTEESISVKPGYIKSKEAKIAVKACKEYVAATAETTKVTFV